MFKVRHIEYEKVSDFWRENEHFSREDLKGGVFDVKRLGHFRNFIQNPKTLSYGLYKGEDLIGVTAFYQWNLAWVRFRTIHIKEEFRGHNLGASLLAKAYFNDCPSKSIFGWMRSNIYGWAEKFGFEAIDQVINDQHKAMVLNAESTEQFLGPYRIAFDDLANT